MSHNPHNNYSSGNKFRYERAKPTSAETPVVKEVVSTVGQSNKKEAYAEKESEILAVVANCRKLNIRKAPDMDADIVTVLPSGSEVMINEKHSTDYFYKVCNSVGIEGYCMKQYIEFRR